MQFCKSSYVLLFLSCACKRGLLLFCFTICPCLITACDLVDYMNSIQLQYHRYHSEAGWHSLVEIILDHYGLETDQAAVTFFVCLVPVALDVFIKFWVGLLSTLKSSYKGHHTIFINIKKTIFAVRTHNNFDSSFHNKTCTRCLNQYASDFPSFHISATPTLTHQIALNLIFLLSSNIQQLHLLDDAMQLHFPETTLYKCH